MVDRRWPTDHDRPSGRVIAVVRVREHGRVADSSLHDALSRDASRRSPVRPFARRRRRVRRRRHRRRNAPRRRTMPPKVEVKKDKLTDAEKKKIKQANKVRTRGT